MKFHKSASKNSSLLTSKKGKYKKMQTWTNRTTTKILFVVPSEQCWENLFIFFHRAKNGTNYHFNLP